MKTQLLLLALLVPASLAAPARSIVYDVNAAPADERCMFACLLVVLPPTEMTAINDAIHQRNHDKCNGGCMKFYTKEGKPTRQQLNNFVNGLKLESYSLYNRDTPTNCLQKAPLPSSLRSTGMKTLPLLAILSVGLSRVFASVGPYSVEYQCEYACQLTVQWPYLMTDPIFDQGFGLHEENKKSSDHCEAQFKGEGEVSLESMRAFARELEYELYDYDPKTNTRTEVTRLRGQHALARALAK